MDFRHAARTLRRTPAFAITAIAMLALAIGATAGMFSVVRTVLLDPLPYAAPDRLVTIAATAPGSEQPPEFSVSAEFYVQYQEQSRLLEDLATYSSFTSTLRADDHVERVRMAWSTPSLFPTLGATPLIGRLPVAADEDGAILISHALWTDWFGRDPAVLGRPLQASGKTRTVVGVMPPGFGFPSSETLVWMSSPLGAADIDEVGDFGLELLGRVAPGTTRAMLADELTQLARRLPERFGGSPAYARTIAQHRAVVRTLEESLLGDVTRPLWVLLGATAIVLLIACANVANLFLVRTEGRFRELAMRRALGAARHQLVRLQLAESLLVAGAAAVLALALAAIVLPLFLRVAPLGIPRLDQVSVGWSTLLFTAVAALCSAVLCGLVPALRGSTPDLTRLREGGRGSTGRRHWVRNGLVVGQTALALVLLIGAGLLLRSAWQLRHVDPGYLTDDIFTFQMAPERPTLTDALAFARFNLDVLDRLAALPGVEAVGLVENMPLNEGTASIRVRTQNTAAGEGALVKFTFAAGDYFGAMRIPLLSGRGFVADDHGNARGNIVVSRSLAQRLWPDRDAIGQRLQREGQDAWETVVGEVGDVLQDDFQTPPEAVVYFPMADTTATGGRTVSSPAFVLRSTRADSIAPEVRALVREIAPEAPMYRSFTMAGLVADSMVQLSFTLLTLGIASVLALLLGAVGLYAVLSYVVAERTREIGVRMALGARAAQVRGMVVGHGIRVVGAGVAIGVLAALAGTRALGSLLYGVEAIDLATFAGMSLAMVAVGLVASYLPARRASNLMPLDALRRD